MKPGQTTAGFRFVHELGHGARAVVWEVERVETGETVALKILDTLAAGASDRLRQEYTAQQALVHPNIVRAVDLVEVEGRLALVTERVDGPSLRDWLKTHRPERDEALSIFGGVLRGLNAAHEAGLVHRDLSPANILMQRAGRQWVPKIADFGLVKSKNGPKLTESGIVVGTVRYMPPEQLNNPSGVDARADLFSAGCILFELLVGERCFSAPNKVAVMNAIRHKRHAPIPHSLGAEVRALIESMIDPNPDERPASAAAVLDVLSLPHVSEQAHPDPSVPWTGVALGMALGMVVFGGAIALWFAL